MKLSPDDATELLRAAHKELRANHDGAYASAVEDAIRAVRYSTYKRVARATEFVEVCAWFSLRHPEDGPLRSLVCTLCAHILMAVEQ